MIMNKIKKILLLFIIPFLLNANDIIGYVEKGKIDRFEDAYALVYRNGKVITVSNLGFKIKKNDVIKTFRRSNLQIRLKDNTVIKIGKKSTLKIAKYMYNKSKGNLDVSIENGSFQIKTGNIAKKSPKNFKVRTRFATIGIRGWK